MCRFARPSLLLNRAIRCRTSGDLKGEASWLRQCVSRLESACRSRAENVDVERVARFYLALQNCQLGHFGEADKQLAHIGLSSRLGDGVWLESCTQPLPEHFFARVFDEGLTPELINAARWGLRQESPYWEDHRYHEDELAFYSHAHIPGDEAHVIDGVIKAMWPLLAKVAPHVADSVTVAEWWVHKRSPRQWHGHPLHFDTNEQLLRDSRGAVVEHPAISSVVYLCDNSPRFGPTIVTDQLMGASDKDGGHATLVYPKPGRVLFFDGAYLHGALPGKPWLAEPCDQRMRLNLMVGWWTSDVKLQHVADPPRPMMRTDSAARWVRELSHARSMGECSGGTTSRPKHIQTLTTSPTWVDVPPRIVTCKGDHPPFGRFFLEHRSQIDEDLCN